jgi:phosphonate degradation associated HDIG domain protein
LKLNSSGEARLKTNVIERLLQLLRERGHAQYSGEAISQQEHALQAAQLAEQANAEPALISAALLHDIGHLLYQGNEDCAEQGIDNQHEELASRWLAQYFPPVVAECVRLHVQAKRYLCATDENYLQQLSPASILSLELQGGPMASEEVRDFEENPFFRSAMRVRRWDDEAKTPGLETPPLEHYVPFLERAILVLGDSQDS